MERAASSGATVDLAVRIDHGDGGPCVASAEWGGRRVRETLRLDDAGIERALATLRDSSLGGRGGAHAQETTGARDRTDAPGEPDAPGATGAPETAEARAATREVEVSRAGGGAGPGAALEDGARLFDALFTGAMREVYAESRAAAERARLPWRLVLEIAVERLVQVPWELLRDADPGGMGSLSCRGSVVRRPSAGGRAAPAPRASKVHVSWVAASPRGYGALDLAQERRVLDEALAAVPEAMRPVVEPLPHVPAELFERLRRRGDDATRPDRESHVLHLACHGLPARNAGERAEGQLVLATPGGDAHLVDTSTLAEALIADRSLRLVVLNACHGATPVSTDALASIAARLSARGVPAVIGMQAAILDRFAIHLTRCLYERLAHGERIDSALREARASLQVHEPGWIERGPWAAPVLWLSGEGAEVLVQRPAPEETAPRAGDRGERDSAEGPAPAAAHVAARPAREDRGAQGRAGRDEEARDGAGGGTSIAAPPRFTAVGPAPEHVAIGRLPVTGEHLFGRDGELARLDACWGAPGTRVVSIVAMGGAGKSALVDRWLQRMQADGWRGAERVYGWSFYSQGATGTGSSDPFFAEALRWFGHAGEIPVSAWERGALLGRLARKHRTLLVLDGLEPLQTPPGPDEGRIRDLGVASLVRELAAGSCGLCVISTRIAVTDLASREGTCAPRIDLEQLSPEDGAQLLEALGANGSSAEREEASREMRGHALALTLLGRFIARAYRGDVRRRGEIPSLFEEKTGGGHARRVMDAYATWFGEGPEVAVLRLLGLFDRPADEGCLKALRAAPAIAGLTDRLVEMSEVEWNETLSALRDARLVAEAPAGDVETGEPEVIDAHPIVREHFGDRLRNGAPEAWRAGHGRVFEHLQRAAPELPETVAEMAPLYAAVVHGCHAGRQQETLDEVFWKRVYRGEEKFNWRKLGAFGAELGMLAAFFDPPWTRVAPGLTEAAAAFVLNAAGFALRALGRLGDAAEPMQLGLEKDLAREEWKNAGIAASNLSELHLARGAMAKAVVAGQHAVELADRSGDAFERMSTRPTLADALHQVGRVDDAAALFEEAEVMQKEWWPESPLLYSLPGFQYCDLLLGRGEIENVLSRARRMFEWRLPSDSLVDIALDHLSLGRGSLALALRDHTGDLARARAELDTAVASLRRAGTQNFLPLGLLARAELFLATPDLPAAEGDLDEALDIATRGGMRLHETDAHLGFARLHLARGDLPPARASLAKAKALVVRTGYHRRDPDLAAIEAELARAEAMARPTGAPEPVPVGPPRPPGREPA